MGKGTLDASKSGFHQELINQAENFFYLQNKMSEFGEPFIDFFSIIQKNNWTKNEMFLENDLDHLSPLGHKRLADVLYEFLDNNRQNLFQVKTPPSQSRKNNF